MVPICTVPWWPPVGREDCVLLCLEEYLRPLPGAHGARDRPGEWGPDRDWYLEQLSLRGLLDSIGVLHVSQYPRKTQDRQSVDGEMEVELRPWSGMRGVIVCG